MQVIDKTRHSYGLCNECSVDFVQDTLVSVRVDQAQEQLLGSSFIIPVHVIH